MYDHNLLSQFVRESNAIEGIFADSGDPLYDNHLQAALYTYKGFIHDVQEIHSILMKGQSYATPGIFRRTLVYVGGRICPYPEAVPNLYKHLMDKVVDARQSYVKDPLEIPSEGTLMEWHHELMFIHPFIDGNGRTGRLWLNAQRLYFGYPWATILESQRQAYYSSIRTWIAGKNWQ